MQLQKWIHTVTSDLVELQGVPGVLKQMLFSLSLSIQTLLLRMLMLLPAIPASLLIISVVIAEAILLREKRRLRGGRESGFVYHRLQKLRTPVFYLPFFLWFGVPVAVPASAALLTNLPAAFYLWAAMVLFKRNV